MIDFPPEGNVAPSAFARRLGFLILAASRIAAAFQRWRRIRRRFVVTGAVLILGIVAGDWVAIEMNRDASVAAYSASMGKLAAGMTAQTALMFKTMDTALKAIAASAAIDTVPHAASARPSLDLLTEAGERLSGVGALLIVDASGRIASSVHSERGIGLDVSGEDFFRHFISGADAGPFVGAPVRDGRSGSWTVFIARRIADARGNFAGVAAAQVVLGELETFYQVAMPEHRTVTVMKADGTVLVQYPRRSGAAGTQTSLLSQMAGSTGCSTYYGADIVDADAVVASICPVPGMPLYIQTSLREVDVLAGWQAQRTWFVVGAALAAIGVVLLLRLIARQVHSLEVSELSLAANNAQLAATYERLDVALSNIPQGLCFFDGDHSLVVANARFREI